MPSWKPSSMQKPGYNPVTEDDSSEEHVFENEKAAMYENWRKPGRTNWFFLIIPASISLGTVIALLVLANLASYHPAVPHKSESHSDHHDHSEHAIGAGAHDLPVAATGVPFVPKYIPTGRYYPGRTCGHTWQEAEARGCIFDTISFSWLPPDCYDGQLVEEFDSKIHTPFFYTREGGKAATMEEVRKGHRGFYVPWAHHLWHCGYLFRKMHKAIMAQTPVDSYIVRQSSLDLQNHLLTDI